jgi:hypothetical protein
VSSPAFVLYGPRSAEEETGGRKSKKVKDEWGISPEYEDLIGNLSAKEGDTDKLSTKLNKKKPVTQAPPKPPKPPKPPPPPPQEEISPTTSPAPPQTEDKSKLEEIVKNMQGKGVDMGALLQEALAKMKGIPLRTSQPPPPPKRMKVVATPNPISIPTGIFPSDRTRTTDTNVAQPNDSPAQLPITMPMPLPYTVSKTAPITSTNTAIQLAKSIPDGSSIAPLGFNSLLPIMTTSSSATTRSETLSASPPKMEEPAINQPSGATVPQGTNSVNQTISPESTSIPRTPRGKKRAFDE